MRLNLKLVSVLSLFVAVGITAGLGKIEKNDTKVQTYPTTVCPGAKSNGPVIDYLPDSKTKVSVIPNESGKLKSVGSSVFNSNKPMLVDGGEVTSVSVLKGGSGWLAAIPCSISDGDDWFVAGTSGVTSRGYIEIVNSGLSTAQVDLKIYSKTAPRTTNNTIAANSVKYVKLDSLAPGEDAIAINAITRSGRVSVFMLDNRGSGLRSIGAEFVASAPAPAKTLVIPFVPTPQKNLKQSQTLRVVVPGSVDANIKATIYSGDGSFAPRGVDGESINGGTVRDIDLNPIVANSSYALKIESDVPISASVFTKLNNDFIWSTPTVAIKNTMLRLGGFQPRIRLYGQNIDIAISWIDSNRKSYTKRLTGSDTLYFKSPGAMNSVSFVNFGDPVYGAMELSNSSGVAVLPVVSGSHLESAVLPRSDARAINRN